MSNFFPPPPQPRPDVIKQMSDQLQVMGQQLGAIMNEVRRNTQRLYSLEAAEAVRAEGRAPRRRIDFRSQGGEDAVMWELLNRATTGFYIEVGAFNGYDYSTTYALDAMGWNGLLIEPIPERYEECRVRRPDARVVHAALGPAGSSGTVTFRVTEDVFGGMFSHMGEDSKISKAMAAAVRKTVTVPFTSMNELLKDHRGEIDVASIDVEGSETALLQGFDLHKYRPKVMLIEDDPQDKASPLEGYMRGQPYTQLGWLEGNRLFVRNDLVEEISKRL